MSETVGREREREREMEGQSEGIREFEGRKRVRVSEGESVVESQKSLSMRDLFWRNRMIDGWMRAPMHAWMDIWSQGRLG